MVVTTFTLYASNTQHPVLLFLLSVCPVGKTGWVSDSIAREEEYLAALKVLKEKGLEPDSQRERVCAGIGWGVDGVHCAFF